jgi:hypothetical protein
MVEEILSPRERMAEPGGPMKTILCFEAARDSGSRGFSEACPLFRNELGISPGYRRYEGEINNSPSSPDGVYSSTFSDIDNDIDVGVIVVVRSSRNFNVLIGHPNVVGVDLEILRGSHHDEFDSAFGTKSFVSPFPDRTNLLDGGDT